MTKTGSEPAVSTIPATTMANGAVTLHLPSRPATSAQMKNTSMTATSPAIDHLT